MTNSTPPPSAFPLDDLYRKLGQLVVTFQAIEDLLITILSRLVAHERWYEGRAAFATLGYRGKATLARSLLAERVQAVAAEDPDAPQWGPKFRDLLKRCDELAERRNSLLHATYEFFEHQGELLSVTAVVLALGRGGPTTRRVSPMADIDTTITEAVELSFDLSLAAHQVSRWIGIPEPDPSRAIFERLIAEPHIPGARQLRQTIPCALCAAPVPVVMKCLEAVDFNTVTISDVRCPKHLSGLGRLVRIEAKVKRPGAPVLDRHGAGGPCTLCGRKITVSIESVDEGVTMTTGHSGLKHIDCGT